MGVYIPRILMKNFDQTWVKFTPLRKWCFAYWFWMTKYFEMASITAIFNTMARLEISKRIGKTQYFYDLSLLESWANFFLCKNFHDTKNQNKHVYTFFKPAIHGVCINPGVCCSHTYILRHISKCYQYIFWLFMSSFFKVRTTFYIFQW